MRASVAFFYIALLARIAFALIDDGSAAEEAALQARLESHCRLLTEAVHTVASARNRPDLFSDADGDPPCPRIYLERCPYLVEIQYELHALGMMIMSAKLGDAFPNCEAHLAFATKHGLASYRDAVVLLGS